MWYSYKQIAKMATDFGGGLIHHGLVTHDENVAFLSTA